MRKYFLQFQIPSSTGVSESLIEYTRRKAISSVLLGQEKGSYTTVVTLAYYTEKRRDEDYALEKQRSPLSNTAITTWEEECEPSENFTTIRVQKDDFKYQDQYNLTGGT